MAGFHSAGDGRVTTRFDLGLPQYRYGIDPDRYIDEMSRARLTTAGPMVEDGPPRSARGAHLLEIVTGVELTAAMLEAPLISATLRHAF